MREGEREEERDERLRKEVFSEERRFGRKSIRKREDSDSKDK